MEICFWREPEKMAFFVCRVVEITLEHGVCEESVYGLAQYAGVALTTCKEEVEIRESCRVSKTAMILLQKRYQSKPELVPKVYVSHS